MNSRTAVLGDPLTSRDLEIMERVAQGETNEEIGKALGIAENTVSYYIGGVLRKTGLRNRVAIGLYIGERHALATVVLPQAEPDPLEVMAEKHADRLSILRGHRDALLLFCLQLTDRVERLERDRGLPAGPSGLLDRVNDARIAEGLQRGEPIRVVK